MTRVHCIESILINDFTILHSGAPKHRATTGCYAGFEQMFRPVQGLKPPTYRRIGTRWLLLQIKRQTTLHSTSFNFFYISPKKIP